MLLLSLSSDGKFDQALLILGRTEKGEMRGLKAGERESKRK